jgi:hypothetical protein
VYKLPREFLRQIFLVPFDKKSGQFGADFVLLQLKMAHSGVQMWVNIVSNLSYYTH